MCVDYRVNDLIAYAARSVVLFLENRPDLCTHPYLCRKCGKLAVSFHPVNLASSVKIEDMSCRGAFFGHLCTVTPTRNSSRREWCLHLCLNYRVSESLRT